MEPRRTIAAFGLVLFLFAFFGGLAVRSLQMNEEAVRSAVVQVPKDLSLSAQSQTTVSQRLVPETKTPVELESATWSEDGGIEVIFYGGNANCYQFEGSVEKVDDTAAVKVYAGQITVSTESRVCTAEARLYSMLVPTPSDLRFSDLPITDGSLVATPA